jgi:hypothetical protein
MLSVIMLSIIMLSVITLSVTFIFCYAECQYAKCHYAECQYAACHYAECHYAECHYAECHSAKHRYSECHYSECRYAECHYAECRILFFVMLSVVAPLSVIILDVILPIVTAAVPFPLRRDVEDVARWPEIESRSFGQISTDFSNKIRCWTRRRWSRLRSKSTSHPETEETAYETFVRIFPAWYNVTLTL